MKLQMENRRLKRELARQAAVPTGDEAADELKALREKAGKLEAAAIQLHAKVSPAYTEVLESRQTSKLQHVFRLGVDVKAFLEENFKL